MSCRRLGKLLEIKTEAIDGEPEAHQGHRGAQIGEVCPLIREMLGEMRATDATPVLIQYLFLRTTEAQMKQRILAALGKIGDMRAARPIIEFLQRDLDAATRGTAIFALGDIGAPESVEALQQIAAEDSDQTVRRLARDALNKVQHHQAAMQKQVKGPSETFLPKEPPPQ